MKVENLKYDITAPGAKKAVAWFFFRLALLFITWHFIYGQFLFPTGVIDSPLANLITSSVTKCVNILSPGIEPITWATNPYKHHNYLVQNNKMVFSIDYSCLGINLMFTYVSIIVLLPYPAMRKIIFSIGGIIAIIIANIIRITALYFIFIYHKTSFDFNHHYLFTLLIDILIFYGWLLFIKKKKIA